MDCTGPHSLVTHTVFYEQIFLTPAVSQQREFLVWMFWAYFRAKLVVFLAKKQQRAGFDPLSHQNGVMRLCPTTTIEDDDGDRAKSKGLPRPFQLKGNAMVVGKNAKKSRYIFSNCACHPCAGAMLIFSVSFQFYIMCRSTSVSQHFKV
jgi:hypothetical protein